MSSPRTHEQSSSVRQNLQLAALGYGIVENRLAIVKQCIEDGVDVNAITPFSEVKPLDLALESRNVSVMRLLLEGGAHTEAKTTQGSTTLINASRFGYLECVELLVEHGANIYARDSDGKTCLHVALEKGHYSVASCLLIHDAYVEVLPPGDGLCLLQHLILTDDAALISNLKHYADYLDSSWHDGSILVFFALQHCKNKALKGLLQAGANPNIHNAGGNSVLCEAVEENNIDAVRLLIQYDADYHLKDKGSRSPIGRAIFNSSKPIVKLLLDSGVDIERGLGFAGTPLIWACSVGYLEGVQLLVERGANLNAHTADGRTCLLVALEHGHPPIADYLLDLDACEVNASGKDGLSALHYAILLNNVDMTRKLIQKQADVNIQNHDGEVALYLVAKHDKLDLLHMLLEAGADPNIDTKDGDSVLQEAVRHGNLEAVKLLLKHGADKDR